MQTALDCYPCFLRQALSAARRAQADPAVQHRVLRATMERLSRSDGATTPIELAADIHRLVREHTGHSDPYLAAKEDATRQALALYPRLEALITNAADPLQAAVRVAIAGNIIGFGVAEHYDLEAALERVMQQPFTIDGVEPLRQALQQAKGVLYPAGNTGGTVFDRVLIETLAIPVAYVVKGTPVLSDATRTAALAAAIDQVAAIVDNRSDAPGTLLETCSEDFRRRFAAADLILAKGQGNYESLSEVQALVFLFPFATPASSATTCCRSGRPQRLVGPCRRQLRFATNPPLHHRSARALGRPGRPELGAPWDRRLLVGPLPD